MAASMPMSPLPPLAMEVAAVAAAADIDEEPAVVTFSGNESVSQVPPPAIEATGAAAAAGPDGAHPESSLSITAPAFLLPTGAFVADGTRTESTLSSSESTSTLGPRLEPTLSSTASASMPPTVAFVADGARVESTTSSTASAGSSLSAVTSVADMAATTATAAAAVAAMTAPPPTVCFAASPSDAGGKQNTGAKLESESVTVGSGARSEGGAGSVRADACSPSPSTEGTRTVAAGGVGNGKSPDSKGSSSERRSSPPSLSEWLKEGPFALAMAPGFFGFYAHTGALMALEDAGLLDTVSFAAGASAGALTAGLFAAGLSPREMGRTVVKFRRADFWDPIGLGGFLKGKKFEDIVDDNLPEGVRCFDQCRVPLAVSAFDVSRLTTRRLMEGSIAPSIRASCTFPGLFAPVWHPRGVLVDGGTRDTTGMWCVPEGRKDCRRVLNVTFGSKDSKGVCVPPSRFPTASNPRPADGMEIVSLALTGLPRPHPFAMERGADAMEAARSQVAAILAVPLLTGHEALHWIAPTTAQQPRPNGGASSVSSGAVDGGCASRKTSRGVKSEAAGAGCPAPAAAAGRSRQETARVGGKPLSSQGMKPSLLLDEKKKRKRTSSWSCHDDDEAPPSSGAAAGNSNRTTLVQQERSCSMAGGDGVDATSRVTGAEACERQVVATSRCSDGRGESGPWSPPVRVVPKSSGRAIEEQTPRRSKRARRPKVPYTGS